MKKLFIFFLLISITIFSFGRTITGSGKANTLDEAKKEALRDISTQIQVKVVSEFSKEETVKDNNNYDATKTSKINISSTNDLLGVEFMTNEIKGTFIVEAFLDEIAIPLYEYEINELSKKISLSVNNSLLTDDLVFKKNYLEEALISFDKWETYKSVVLILGSKNTYENEFSKAYIQNLLVDIQRVFEEKKIIFLQFEDLFDDDSNNEYLEKEINQLLTSIARKNEDSLRITNDLEKKNVTFTVSVDSSYVETVPPVFYNKKKISNEFYKGEVSLTIIIFNELTKSRLASFSVSGSAKSFTNESNAIDKSIRKVLADRKTKTDIENALLNKK